MAAIDADIQVVAPVWQFARRMTTLALGGTAIALALAIGAFSIHGGDANAMRFATQTVFRASTVAFLLFYLATPLAHLLPSRPTLALARERTGLAVAFACMYAVFLGCAVAPGYFAGAQVSLATLTFAAFSAVILAAVLAGERAVHADPSWRPALRTMEIIGVAYFWAVYAVNDLDHLYGPHRPDGYYGASLMILVLALLGRFADSFRQRHRYARRRVAFEAAGR